MRQASRYQLPLTLLLLMGALRGGLSVSAEPTIRTQGFKETASIGGPGEDPANGFIRTEGMGNSQVRANSPLLAVPLSLARFMFPKSLDRGRGGGNPPFLMMSVGNKRSAQGNVASGALDTLIGASGLGKRSVPSDYINIEQVLPTRPVAVWRGVAPQAHGRLLLSSSAWDPASGTQETFEAGDEV